jgi:hypothetical protein
LLFNGSGCNGKKFRHGTVLARDQGVDRKAEATKPPQVALVTLARKLLRAVWALLRQGVCFDESSFARQG